MVCCLDKGDILCRSDGFCLVHGPSSYLEPFCLVVLGAALLLSVLATETKVLVDEEFACGRVAGGEDGESNDNTFLSSELVIGVIGVFLIRLLELVRV